MRLTAKIAGAAVAAATLTLALPASAEGDGEATVEVEMVPRAGTTESEILPFPGGVPPTSPYQPLPPGSKPVSKAPSSSTTRRSPP